MKIVTYLFLMIMSIGLVSGTGAYVQSRSEYGTDGVLAYTSSVTSGNLLVMVSSSNINNTAVNYTVSDTQGNTWIVATKQYVTTPGSPVGIEVLYTFASSSGANTVTINGESGDVGMAIYEYSGIANSGTIENVSIINQSASTTTPIARSFSTNNPSMFFFSFADENVANTFTAGNGYTLRQTQTSHIDAQQDKMGQPAGTYSSESITLSTATARSAVLVVAFKESGSTDNEYPNFYNITTLANGTQIGTGQFNTSVSINKTNSTAGIQFNNVNFSMRNISSWYNYTNLSQITSGTYAYHFWAYGNGTNKNYNSSGLYYFTINATPVVDDTKVPQFYNYTEQQANNTMWNYSLITNFSVTINQTNNTAFIQMDGTNYSLTRTGSWFNYTFNNKLTAGSHLYIYSAYNGSNSSGVLYNKTIREYYLQKAYPLLTLTCTTPLEYGVSTDCATSENNLGDNDLTYSLSPSNSIIGAGITTIFNYSTSGGQNYTANSTIKSVTINQNTTHFITPLLNGVNANLAVTFPQQINMSYSNANVTNVIIKINGTTVTKGTNYSWGAGDWVVEWNETGNQNYTQKLYYYNITISRASSGLTLLINDTSTNVQNMTYPSQINASAKITNSEQTIILLRNGTDITSSNHLYQNILVSYYNYTASVLQTQNYTSSTITLFVNLTKAYPILTLTGTTPITYGTAGDVTGSESNTGDGDLTYTLKRDGTTVSNPDTTTLGAGTYIYNYSVSNGQNYTYNSTTFTLTVNKATSSVNLWLNHTASNITINAGDTIYLNASIGTGQNGRVTIYRAGSIINNGTGNIFNQTTFSTAGTENIGANHEGNQNYTSSWYNYTVTINVVGGAITPLLNGANSNLVVTFPQQINASYSGNNATQVIISINGTVVTIGTNYTWGGGSWTVKYNLTGDGSHQENISYLNFTMNKATGEVATYLGGFRSNRTKDNSTTNYNLSAETISGEGRINLTFNGTQIAYGTTAVSSLINLTNYWIGLYILNASLESTQNYTSITEWFYLNITEYVTPTTTNATGVSAVVCKYKKLGFYNLRIPTIWKTNCI